MGKNKGKHKKSHKKNTGSGTNEAKSSRKKQNRENLVCTLLIKSKYLKFFYDKIFFYLNL